MQIVEASVDDLSHLKRLWYQLAVEMEPYSTLNEIVADNVSEVSDEEFAKHLRSDTVEYHLIMVDDLVVGFVTLSFGLHPSRVSSKYVRVVNLYVDEEFRSQGIGSDVLLWVKERAKSEDCSLIKVSFEQQNVDAERFYIENGFEVKTKTAVWEVL